MALMDNSAKISFGTTAAAVTVSQYRATFGTGATEISTGWIALDEQRAFAASDELEIDAGELNIELPAGDFPNAFAKGFLDDFLAARGANVKIELGHGGSEIADTGYSEQTATFAAEL